MNVALIEADLERDEGYRQFPYTDSVGKLTIGIGFNLETYDTPHILTRSCTKAIAH